MTAKNTPAATGSGGILAIIFPGGFLAATLYKDIFLLAIKKKTNATVFYPFDSGFIIFFLSEML